VYVHKLLKTVLEVHRLPLNECHGEVVFDLLANRDVVLGDLPHLANAFSNLIDNAIKYRKDNLVITISTRNVGDNLEIRFSDNGIGISRSDQKLIFEPFTRVNTDNEHYVKGYGLGLNYVMHVVEYHKGTIKLESELGKGSTFIVSLPLKGR
jgi:two-component system phosphate regulon sensor histidine kinase PhoR